MWRFNVWVRGRQCVLGGPYLMSAYLENDSWTGTITASFKVTPDWLLQGLIEDKYD
jgi:hypothetical protein